MGLAGPFTRNTMLRALMEFSSDVERSSGHCSAQPCTLREGAMGKEKPMTVYRELLQLLESRFPIVRKNTWAQRQRKEFIRFDKVT